jgi:hypothetical protein
VPVEQHCVDPELRAQTAHGQGMGSFLVEQLDGLPDDRLPGKVWRASSARAVACESPGARVWRGHAMVKLGGLRTHHAEAGEHGIKVALRKTRVPQLIGDSMAAIGRNPSVSGVF